MAEKKGKLVVISGPSGVGKTTITRQVQARTGAAFSVSATTRPPRPDEVEGRDYRFVSRTEFQRMIDGGELLEWAEVFGQLYGTPQRPVRQAVAAGETILLDIDVQGGLQVHRKCPEATFILIVPPDEAELARRLRQRGSEDEPSLARRLAKALEEIRTAQDSGVYNLVVVNDDLDAAISRVVEIVNRQ